MNRPCLLKEAGQGAGCPKPVDLSVRLIVAKRDKANTKVRTTTRRVSEGSLSRL